MNAPPSHSGSSGCRRRLRGWLMIFGPGLIVAATGIGAGDLATAGFAGSKLGLAVMWAIVLGAFFKFVLNEGIARWQLATGTTLLEGALTRLRPVAPIVFLLYLLPWTYVVCAALISACGVTTRAMFPDVYEDPTRAKIFFGGAHSLFGVLIAWFGGFKLFERIMAVCVGVMFIAVTVTAVLVGPELSGMLRGLFVPTVPDGGEGWTWTIALMGGVGGTLTILCYGYWIREENRTSTDDLRTCRIDLIAGYTVTALFGLAMLIIAQGIELEGKGAGLIVSLANRLHETIGPAGRWIFLIGAWAAVFSSLLGVWQSVPYVFADYWRTVFQRQAELDQSAVDTRGVPYRAYLLGLAIVPLYHVLHPFESVQKAYAVVGAGFIPLLAIVLVILNGRKKWVGAHAVNRPWTIIALLAVLSFFAVAGVLHFTR